MRTRDVAVQSNTCSCGAKKAKRSARKYKPEEKNSHEHTIIQPSRAHDKVPMHDH